MKLLHSISIALSFLSSTQAQWRPADTPLLTKWGRELNSQQVWSEHPRPQLQRERWTNLNGLWDFVVSGKNAPEEKTWWEKRDGDRTTGVPPLRKILVPFCPESGLNGVSFLALKIS